MKTSINVPPQVYKLLLLEENHSQALWNAYLKVRGLRLVTKLEIVGTKEVSITKLVDKDGIELTQE